MYVGVKGEGRDACWCEGGRCMLRPSSSFSSHLSHRWAVILAFDVKVEREAQEYADTVGVKIFTADIIYHLFDKFMKYRQVGSRVWPRVMMGRRRRYG